MTYGTRKRTYVKRPKDLQGNHRSLIGSQCIDWTCKTHTHSSLLTIRYKGLLLTCLLTMSTSTQGTLYDRILGDPNLKDFFVGTSVQRLKTHQKTFFKVVFTSIPDDMDVPRLILTKHERLFQEKGLDETHFDLVAGHLVATLASLGIDQALIDEAVGIVATLRPVFEQGAKMYGKAGAENGASI
jgi:hemoglobin